MPLATGSMHRTTTTVFPFQLNGYLKEKIVLSIVCILVFAGTATFKAEWILVVKELLLQYHNASAGNLVANSSFAAYDARALLHRWHLQNVPLFIAGSLTVSFLLFYGVGAFFHYNYYVRQKDKPESWKCQPDRFLTPSLERHEILLGSLNLVIGSCASGSLACYIYNGGKTMMYFNIHEHGLLYFFLSIPAFYLLVDGFAYYVHMALHWPIFYKNIHKYHHRYYAPTTFGAIAMHPAEFIALNAAIFIPIFAVPVHASITIVTAVYIFYYGMVDHSGVMMDSIWPWQPESKFHDDHHKYFHVNFGFNCKLFDWLHDTLRRDDREYGEDVFYGRGRKKTDRQKSE